VLAGQVTVVFADSNTGKTLLTFWQIIQGIKSGNVDPSTVYYMNADDSLNGLLEKAVIAERFGFNMIGDGERDFQARDFPRILAEITETGHAHGVVLIVDTVKKVTDVMDKRVSTAFGDVARRFAMRGGTAILLAHTNKKLDADGRPVPGGTSDLRQDADAAYTIRTISEPGAARKVVEYENIKRRGDVCQRAGFSYSTARGLTYEETLASVQRVEDDQVDALEVAADRRADDEVIRVVRDCIREGIVKRMDLMAAVGQRSKGGRRNAEKLLDKYTGTDPLQHHWTYDVGPRGAKLYRVLEPSGDSPAGSATSTPTPREPGNE
jgi:archaellum biogenesis ATPase FlaH